MKIFSHTVSPGARRHMNSEAGNSLCCMLFALILLGVNGVCYLSASAQSYLWNIDAVGSWNNPMKWSPNTGFPNGIDGIANLNFNITADRIITLNVPATLGTLDLFDASFSSAYSVTGSGANVLTFDVLAENAKINIGNGTSAGGNNTVSAGIVLIDRVGITLNNAEHRATWNLTCPITGGVAPGQVAIYINNPTSVLSELGMEWNEVVFNTGTNTYTGQLSLAALSQS